MYIGGVANRARADSLHNVQQAENLTGQVNSQARTVADIVGEAVNQPTADEQGRSERRILPPMQRIERREQMAAIGKDFKQWADDYFAPGSGNLDCELKQTEVLASHNSEATYQLKMALFTRKLKEYCALAEHIHCLNPACITGLENDGERWRKREKSGQLRSLYYVMSAQAAAETAKMEPAQTELTFADNQEEA